MRQTVYTDISELYEAYSQALAREMAEAIDRDLIESLSSGSLRDDLNEMVRKVRERYPHDCPRCGAPAYIGLNDVECSAGCA